MILKAERGSRAADAVAALVGWAVVILFIGLTVGNDADAHTVLHREPRWKDLLHFLWQHPPLMVVFGSILGLTMLAILQAASKKIAASIHPSDGRSG
jgi:hypothetical protein